MKTSNYQWIHGNAGMVENPLTVLLLRNTETSLRLVGQAGSTNWIRYPMVIPPDALIHQISVRYCCDSAFSAITNIVLHDAEVCIFKAAGIFHNSIVWETISVHIPDMPCAVSGLQLSIGIRFDGPDSETQAIEISSVGVLFS